MFRYMVMCAIWLGVCASIHDTACRGDEAKVGLSGESNDDVKASELRQQAASLLQASMSNALLWYPLDVFVRCNVTDEFDGVPARFDEREFRLRLDRDAKRMIWCGREKADSILDAFAHKDGLPRYYGSMVVDSRLTVYGVSQNRTTEFDGFLAAAAGSFAPLPQHWGVIGFPGLGGDAQEALKQLKAALLDTHTKVSIGDNSDGKIVVRAKHSPEPENKHRFDVFTWVLSEVDYRITAYTLDRSFSTGNPVRYWEQEIIYEENDGLFFPSQIFAETIIARPNQGSYELGTRYFRSSVAQVPQREAETPVMKSLFLTDLVEFLNSGLLAIKQAR